MWPFFIASYSTVSIVVEDLGGNSRMIVHKLPHTLLCPLNKAYVIVPMTQSNLVVSTLLFPFIRIVALEARSFILSKIYIY